MHIYSILHAIAHYGWSAPAESVWSAPADQWLEQTVMAGIGWGKIRGRQAYEGCFSIY